MCALPRMSVGPPTITPYFTPTVSSVSSAGRLENHLSAQHWPARLRVGPVLVASLFAGFVAAVFLVLVPFGGAHESVITAVALFAFALGWALLAVISIRFTDQPQRWAFMPAGVLAAAGGALLLWPDAVSHESFSWTWPILVLGLVLWTTALARTRLQSRTKRWLLYPLFGVLALAAITGLWETVQESRDRRAITMNGRMIDVGGRRLYLSVSGAGSPTVVLLPGAGGITSSWAWIEPAVARVTRVCSFDRAGRGWSESASTPQGGREMAADLHALLDRGQVPGPYVMVGHSFGGLLALTYADLYPQEVAGLVLLDSTHPDMFTRLATYPRLYEVHRRVSALFPSLARLGVGRLAYRSSFDSLPPAARDAERAVWATARQARSALDEWVGAPDLMKQARALETLGARPLIVVTAAQDAQDGWMPLQNELARLSANSAHRVLPTTSHMSLVLNRADAALASRAILDVVGAVRTSAALKGS